MNAFLYILFCMIILLRVPMFLILNISYSSMVKLSIIKLGFGHCAFKSHSTPPHKIVVPK